MEARERLVDWYQIYVNDIVVGITITAKEDEPVPIYSISITNISNVTKIILEKIRDEFVAEETKTLTEEETTYTIQEQFRG